MSLAEVYNLAVPTPASRDGPVFQFTRAPLSDCVSIFTTVLAATVYTYRLVDSPEKAIRTGQCKADEMSRLRPADKRFTD